MATECLHHGEPFQHLPFQLQTTQCGQQDDILAFQLLPTDPAVLEELHIISNSLMFEIFFLTKCQWDVSVHCLPVFGKELERSAAAMIYCDARCSLDIWGSCNTPPTPGHSYLLPVQGRSCPARPHDWLLYVLGSLLSCQRTNETFPDHPLGRANTPSLPRLLPLQASPSPSPPLIACWPSDRLCIRLCVCCPISSRPESRDFFSLLAAGSQYPEHILADRRHQQLHGKWPRDRCLLSPRHGWCVLLKAVRLTTSIRDRWSYAC